MAYVKEEGVIKKFDRKRGFGFIVPNNGGKDVFFHINGLIEGIEAKDISEGLKVNFEIYENAKGFNAKDVCPC